MQVIAQDDINMVFGVFVCFSVSETACYEALADLKINMQTKLASNLQRCSCLCFLNAVITDIHHYNQHT